MKLFFTGAKLGSGALAMTLGALTLAGCGGGTSPQRPNPTPTPNPNATPVPTATPAPSAALLNNIIFVSNRDGNNEIYSMRADGSSQTRLTTSPAPDNSPSRSRDGRRIVFSSQRAGNPEIYSMGIEGEAAGLLRLTADSGISAPDDIAPVFSADGNRIAWISTRGGSANVWIMDSTGNNQRQFTTEGKAATPAFSPDGTEIAFSVARPVTGTTGGSVNSIIVAKNIVSGIERIVAQGDFSALAPRYSPNGNQLVFTARTPNSQARRLKIVNLATGAISDGPGDGNAGGSFDIAAAFSPDGSRLTFEVAGAPSPQVGVSSGLSGAGATILTSQGLNFAPSWGQ